MIQINRDFLERNFNNESRLTSGTTLYIFSPLASLFWTTLDASLVYLCYVCRWWRSNVVDPAMSEKVRNTSL